MVVEIVLMPGTGYHMQNRLKGLELWPDFPQKELGGQNIGKVSEGADEQQPCRLGRMRSRTKAFDIDSVRQAHHWSALHGLAIFFRHCDDAIEMLPGIRLETHPFLPLPACLPVVVLRYKLGIEIERDVVLDQNCAHPRTVRGIGRPVRE